MVQEKDCLRLVTGTYHEIIQRVPQVVVDIFRINSTSPGSYLLEASKQFQVARIRIYLFSIHHHIQVEFLLSTVDFH